MEHQTPVQEVPVQETPPSVQTEAKKTSVFTKWWFWFLIIILAVSTLAYFFLADLFEDSSIVLYNDDAVEQEEQAIVPETFEQEEAELEGQAASWDSLGIPAIFPEYTDGDIQLNIFGFEWAARGVPNMLSIYNTSEEEIERYVYEAVEENGWTLQWEREQMGDEMNSWAIDIEANDTVYTALLEYHEDNSEEYLIMFLGEGTVFD